MPDDPDNTESPPQGNPDLHELSHPGGNWAKCFESTFDKWRWRHDSKVIHLFLYLVTRANWAPSFHHGIRIERGQVLTGLFKLKEETGLSPQSIRTATTKLKSTNEISVRATNKFTIITIHNYDTFHPDREVSQQTENGVGQQTNNKRTTNEQQHPKNTKKKKKEEEDPAERRKPYPTDDSPVLLSPNDEVRLRSFMSEKSLLALVNDLANYSECNPQRFAKYKSHYLTLLNWYRRNQERTSYAQ